MLLFELYHAWTKMCCQSYETDNWQRDSKLNHRFTIRMDYYCDEGLSGLASKANCSSVASSLPSSTYVSFMWSLDPTRSITTKQQVNMFDLGVHHVVKFMGYCSWHMAPGSRKKSEGETLPLGLETGAKRHEPGNIHYTCQII